MATYIQVYTGPGKGKTTAAIGLAIRAIGAGHRVLFLQFMKSKAYSEHKILPTLPNLDLVTVGKPFFIAKKGMLSDEEIAAYGDEVVVFEEGHPPASYQALIEEGFKMALEGASSGKYDLVVLDEYNVALYFDLLNFEQTEQLLAAKHPDTELVFTGRGAPKALLERADLVTTMEETKHYYTKGVSSRIGIEQ